MKFWKYQGAGNDFIMVDQRQKQWLTRTDTDRIARLCDRRFGIGADGLILLESKSGFDFEMIYFNADGRESTMCGNGGRCIAAFAHHLGIVGEKCLFHAIDGPHEASIRAETADNCWVELKMIDVQQVEYDKDAYVLNTGSPHYVQFVSQLDQKDMVREGKAVRYGERFKQEGINVNLIESNPDGTLKIRTYERGVEDETLACGTGVTAAAIAAFIRQKAPLGDFEIPVHARGGDLAVRFSAQADGSFSQIWLCGPAVRVFEGTIQ
ncbi:MAG TPA: diaminopimelate epimerase [Saprospiraceae bacterium]|nr:diaminopimelate epimerase [Saprospiraceae bacterium]